MIQKHKLKKLEFRKQFYNSFPDSASSSPTPSGSDSDSNSKSTSGGSGGRSWGGARSYSSRNLNRSRSVSCEALTVLDTRFVKYCRFRPTVIYSQNNNLQN